jgi:hypothetical protein
VGETLGVSQQEERRIDRLRSEEQAAGGVSQEALGAFEDGGSGVTALGWALRP